MTGICPSCGRHAELAYRRAFKLLAIRNCCQDCASLIDAAQRRLAARYPAPAARPDRRRVEGKRHQVSDKETRP